MHKRGSAMKKKHMKEYRQKIDKLEFVTVLLMAIMSLTIFIAASWYTCIKISQALQRGMTEISELAIKSIGDDTVEKVSSLNGAFQLGLFNSGLTIIAIAVTVWIGLNIYNNFKESILEQQLKEVEHKYETLNREYQRVLFLMQLEKTESNYEASKYFYKKFKEEDVEEENIDEEMYDELIQVEKNFQSCCSAYEQKHWHECRDYAKKVINAIQKDTKKCKKSAYVLLRLYMELRCSDALFYINISNKNAGRKVDKDELLYSIEKYKKGLVMLKKCYEFKDCKEHDNITKLNENMDFNKFRERNQCEGVGKEQKELLGYMYNTIGYTYLTLWKEESFNEKWLNDAERYLILAVANNPKGRYIQNLGSFYEKDNKRFDDALRCYEEALKAVNLDPKVYNLIGSLYLKMVDEHIGMDKRFTDRKLLKNMCADFKNEKFYIEKAYIYLDRAVKATPELVDAYFNFAKAIFYYWLWGESKDKNKKKDADMYIKMALERQPDNIGALYVQRNYYEAIGKIDEANEINKKIIEKRHGKGDEKKAEELYGNYIKEMKGTKSECSSGNISKKFSKDKILARINIPVILKRKKNLKGC